MFSTIWHTVFFDPVYNTLVYFLDVWPHGDVGLAIISTVIVVKMLLLPISIKAVKTQKIMREIEPQIKAAKEEHKSDQQQQAKAMMKIYSEAGMNPFASIFLIFLQIPIVIALYFVVARGGGVPLPAINVDLLYRFIPIPDEVTMLFLGLFDISQKSMLLALVAGVTQYIHVRLTLPATAPRVEGKTPTAQEEFMRSMQTSLKYVMPVLITVVAYSTSAAIALYFVVSNLIAIAQEQYIKRHR